MEKNISYYKKIQNAYGTTSKKEVQLTKLRKEISSHFADSIDYENDTFIDGIKQPLMVIKTNEKNIKTVISYPTDTLMVGQTVSCYGEKYLITEVDSNKQVYTKGSMTQCNYTLPFQSPDGTILSYPCIDETNSTVGIDESNTISTLNGIHRIKLPFDENTKLIGVDKRFFLDKSGTTTYKVTNVNNTEFNYGDKGLIELTLRQDSAYNPQTDRVDLGVCNYFEPTVTPPIPDPEVPTEIVTITSDAEDNNIKLGLVYTFNATFTNELGDTVDNAVGQYSLDNTYGGLVVLNDKGDGTCTVQVDEDAYDLLTEQCVLRCYDAAHGFEAFLTLTIIGLF